MSSVHYTAGGGLCFTRNQAGVYYYEAKYFKTVLRLCSRINNHLTLRVKTGCQQPRCTLSRKEATSVSTGFHVGPLSWSN